MRPGWRVARSIQGSAPSQAMRPLLQQPCSLHGYGAYRSWGRAESGNLRRVAAVRSSDSGRLGVRDFARSKHSSRRLVLPIYRPTTVSITPRRYPESPGSSRTAHGAAHGASRRTAPHSAHGRFGPGNPFSAGLIKSTLHYLSRLFPTPPSCKRAGISPASPGSRPNLSGGGARVAGGAPGGFVRAAPRFPSGVLKKMLSWKARSARKSP